MSEFFCISKEDSFQWRTEMKTLCRTLGVHLPEIFAWVEQGLISYPSLEGRFKVLVVKEKDRIPNSEELMRFDAVVGYPFRVTEVLNVIRMYHDQKEFHRMTDEISELALKAKAEVQSKEELLFKQFPDRFPQMKGVKVKSRHLTGLRPGGDYLDVYESKGREWVQVLMTDSSNYGVSSRLLGLLLSTSTKMVSDVHVKSYDWIRVMKEELRSEFHPNDHFSVFLGRLNRADFTLHYQLFGQIRGYVFRNQGQVEALKPSGSEIYFHSDPVASEEQVISLSPKDRIMIISDGFEKVLGREWNLMDEARKKSDQDPFFLVNEMIYQVKSRLVPGETFPAEDCSVLILEMDQRVLRLAPTG